jgi:hypothetical protein
MPLPVEAIVREVLDRRDRHGILYRATTGGWADYENSSEAGRWRRKGTRAAIIWERMVDRALMDFVDDDQVQSIEQNDSMVFVVEQRVLLRLKKADHNGLTRNFPTGTALLFHRHEEGIPGMVPHEHRVEIGYVLNTRETQVESVRVIARDLNKIAWSYEIGSGIATPAPLPLIPRAPRPTAGLVRLRTDLADEKKGDGEQ